MTDWLEIFKIEKEKKGVKSTTIFSINKMHEGDWIELFKKWLSQAMKW